MSFNLYVSWRVHLIGEGLTHKTCVLTWLSKFERKMRLPNMKSILFMTEGHALRVYLLQPRRLRMDGTGVA